MSDPVIIEVAINGATTKAQNPHVPISEDELVADALACFDAGAAIVHHHVAGKGMSGPRRPRCTSACGGGCCPSGPTRCGTRRSTSARRRLVRPHHAAGRVGAAADVAERSGLGQPRQPTRRRAERRVRVRQQLRQHQPPVRAVPRARARAEPRHLRAGLPARRPRPPPRRAAAGGHVRQAVPVRRARPRRGPLRAARRRAGRSTPTSSCSTAPGWCGRCRRSATTSRRSTSARPRSPPAVTCTSGWSSSAATGSRPTSSSSSTPSRPPPTPAAPSPPPTTPPTILALPRHRCHPSECWRSSECRRADFRPFHTPMPFNTRMGSQ